MSDRPVDIPIEGPDTEGADKTEAPKAPETQAEAGEKTAEESLKEEEAGKEGEAGTGEPLEEEAKTEGEKASAGQQSGEDAGETPEDAAGEEPDGETGKADAGEAKTDAGDGDARYLRLLAEFQNYKKRVEKEKSDLYSYANEKIMTELLEVLDNFERALEQPAGDGFKEGMELIFNQLTTCLTKAGLAEIDALGEEFDPNVHNAVMTEETEEYESGKVSGVMQKGYTLNGKVIRPSMVKVVN